MTLLVYSPEMIGDTLVDVECPACFSRVQLNKVPPSLKSALLQRTLLFRDQVRLDMLRKLEQLVERYPRTRNFLIRSKVDEFCYSLAVRRLTVAAMLNNPTGHPAHRARMREQSEVIESLEHLVHGLDSLRPPPTEAEENELSQYLAADPQLAHFLTGVFKLQRTLEETSKRVQHYGRDWQTADLLCPKCQNDYLKLIDQWLDSQPL